MGYQRGGRDPDTIGDPSTAGTTYTAGDGNLIASTTIGPSGVSPELDFSKLKVDILPGECISFLAKVSSGADSNVTVTFNWDEDL